MATETVRKMLGEARAQRIDAWAAERLGEEKSSRRIEIVCSDQASEELLPLLRELKRMGSVGSSRNIKIEDWDGKSDFGFDGDGAAKIDSIKVDGADYAGE